VALFALVMVSVFFTKR